MTSEFPLRIRVQDVWDDVRLAVPASVLAGDIKRRALRPPGSRLIPTAMFSSSAVRRSPIR